MVWVCLGKVLVVEDNNMYLEGKPNFTADFHIVSTLSSMGGKYQSNLGSDGSVIYRMQFVA